MDEVNLILWPIFLLFFVGMWLYIHESAHDSNSWKALLKVYETTESAQTLSATRLHISYYYFDGVYMSGTYHFYASPRGLLLTLSTNILSKQRLLVPWHDIKPGKRLERNFNALQRLEFPQASGVKIDIPANDFTQYFRSRISYA